MFCQGLKNDEIFLQINDNGKGFKLEEQLQSLKTNGIYNMHERINLLNGIFELDSIPAKGTTVKVKIPINWYTPCYL